MTKNQKNYGYRKSYPVFCLLLLILFTILPFSSTANATTEEHIVRIYDYAQTLTEKEKEDLEELAESYYQETENNYLVVTTTTRGEYDYTHGSSLEEDCEQYSKSFYDSFLANYGNNYKNCTILTIDLSENRYADIASQNDLKVKLNNERRTNAINKIKTMLSAGNYSDAYSKYMEVVNRYQRINPNINPDSIFLKIWFQLLISVIIGGCTIGIMIYHSGGKITTTGQNYLDKERSKVLRQDDYYVRTHTTRTKRETNPSDSSSGSSSGGDNHSGTHF